MANRNSKCAIRLPRMSLISVLLMIGGLKCLEAATIASIEVTDTLCPDLFKIRIEGTFNENDHSSGYDFFRTRVFDSENVLIHECACGVEVGGTAFGPFAFWYVFDPPPSANPLRFEIYEDDDQQLPLGELLRVQHLDYDCLPTTDPLLLDGFETGDCRAWSNQAPEQPVVDQAQEDIDYGYWFDDEVIRWQEFIPTLDNLTEVEIFIDFNGSPGNVIVEVATDSDVVLGQVTVAEAVPFSWLKATLQAPLSLMPGARYRIRVYSDTESPLPSDRYFWAGTASSDYCPDCLTDVSDTRPDYDYAFRTHGYP